MKYSIISIYMKLADIMQKTQGQSIGGILACKITTMNLLTVNKPFLVVLAIAKMANVDHSQFPHFMLTTICGLNYCKL